MPRVDEELLSALLQYAQWHALDVAALRSERGIEPLCAVWSTALLSRVTAAIARGELSVRDLIASLPRVGVIDAGGGAYVGDAALNVNTPADLEREREFAARQAPPRVERERARNGSVQPAPGQVRS